MAMEQKSIKKCSYLLVQAIYFVINHSINIWLTCMFVCLFLKDHQPKVGLSPCVWCSTTFFQSFFNTFWFLGVFWFSGVFLCLVLFWFFWTSESTKCALYLMTACSDCISYHSLNHSAYTWNSQQQPLLTPLHSTDSGLL